MTPFSQRITERRILQVLIAGFVAILIITLTTGFVGIQSLRSVRDNATRLVGELRLSSNLIAQIQRQMATLSAVSHRLSNAPGAIDNAGILELVSEAERNIAEAAAGGIGTPEEELWQRLDSASRAYSTEVRHSLKRVDTPIVATRSLFRRHQELISIATTLINLSYRRGVQAQTQIDRQSQRLIREALYISIICGLLAVGLATITILLTGRLIKRLEDQVEELSTVSFHLLQNQEAAARRFSHELHDELGQSLTAVKANLAAVGSNPVSSAERLRDCVGLVDQAIDTVREMSQLLHPRVLDDFGLKMALRSLCERFAERSNIEVNYDSNLEGRLFPNTALNLFRIAQEALTNVAKHSGAAKLSIKLEAIGDRLSLTIQDDGSGLPKEVLRSGAGRGLGLVGMSARARHLGGELTLGNASGKGACIVVQIPLRRISDGASNADSVG
jgi:signal transduction histidine kinase